jgi:hypothetical protein
MDLFAAPVQPPPAAVGDTTELIHMDVEQLTGLRHS